MSQDYFIGNPYLLTIIGHIPPPFSLYRPVYSCAKSSSLNDKNQPIPISLSTSITNNIFPTICSHSVTHTVFLNVWSAAFSCEKALQKFYRTLNILNENTPIHLR